ncbi:hypothetical protein D7X33_03410 [Butyricicoccus sp. 1XD8-22]|nr:hypothetical protein D7X33_03410 [Butyricicoccus sp. 1XD8-22]
MDELFSFVKADYTIIIAVLYFIGIALRKLKVFPNNYIPLSITLVGIGLAALSSLSRLPDYSNLASLAFDSIAQGILCAGMSVYVNEFIKHTRKKSQ